VLVASVVCAEVCRGAARTRAVEAALARHADAAPHYPALRTVDTDFSFARQVGAILHGAEVGSEHLVDAHNVALCVSRGGGVIVTSDPGHVRLLANAVPAIRITTRSPR
jgi:predicted nucleic acid-binding protein